MGHIECLRYPLLLECLCHIHGVGRLPLKDVNSTLGGLLAQLAIVVDYRLSLLISEVLLVRLLINLRFGHVGLVMLGIHLLSSWRVRRRHLLEELLESVIGQLAVEGLLVLVLALLLYVSTFLALVALSSLVLA